MHVEHPREAYVRQAYVLGHSSEELSRLEKQGAVYAAFTEEILTLAGLRPGMRVLDVGCGAGDVSLAAARLVGASGTILGIDRSPAAVALAESRLAAAGVPNARFRVQDFMQPSDDSPFDAVIGRFILLHMPDPVGTLRSLGRRLAPGGVAAFIEMDLTTAEALPRLALFDRALDWMVEAYRRDRVEPDMGSRLHAAFSEAGFAPRLKGHVTVDGGADCYAPEYLAETIRSLLPRIEALGLATADEVAVETLADRLRTESAGATQCFLYPRMIGGWATRA